MVALTKIAGASQPNGASVAGGGSGQVQFNSGSGLAGDTGLTWDNTSKRLALTPGSGKYAATFTGAVVSALSIGGAIADNEYARLTFGNGLYGNYAAIGTKVTSGGSYLSFGTSNNYANGITNEAMTIGPGGYVGIGTSNPTAKLQVIGTIKLSGITGPSAGDTYLCWNSSTGYMSYNSTACNPSDMRLKRNIEPLQGSLDKIMQLRGVSFDWKRPVPGAGHQIGVIAQEVEKVYPEIVGNGSDGFKNVAYGNLVAPLIEAVKELKHLVDALTAKVKDLFDIVDRLKAENAALKATVDAQGAKIETLENQNADILKRLDAMEAKP
jgi:hypothetical protein